MLNGIDPILIFQFSKLSSSVGATIARIPLISDIPTVIDQPPIPVYLSEALTGIYIDSEDKNVDIETTAETQADGTAALIDQKGVSSIVSVNMVASRNSLGLALISSMIDLIFDKVTSKEYSITYMHGAVTVFRGLLHSFSINQNSSNELYTIKIEISKGAKTPQKAPDTPSTPRLRTAVPA